MRPIQPKCSALHKWGYQCKLPALHQGLHKFSAGFIEPTSVDREDDMNRQGDYMRNEDYMREGDYNRQNNTDDDYDDVLRRY